MCTTLYIKATFARPRHSNTKLEFVCGQTIRESMWQNVIQPPNGKTTDKFEWFGLEHDATSTEQRTTNDATDVSAMRRELCKLWTKWIYGAAVYSAIVCVEIVRIERKQLAFILYYYRSFFFFSFSFFSCWSRLFKAIWKWEKRWRKKLIGFVAVFFFYFSCSQAPMRTSIVQDKHFSHHQLPIQRHEMPIPLN